MAHMGDRQKRDGYQVIADVVQQLVLIFDRSPLTDQETTTGTEKALAVEAAGIIASTGERLPPTALRDERLSIAQRALRLLTTCAALGGDDHWGDVLAREALDALLELLRSSEEHEELIITEALAVLVPPVLHQQCYDWVQWSHFELMSTLVSEKPLVGLQLTSLAPTLQRIAVQELGTGPTPLYELMGKLARYEDDFPRTKAAHSIRDAGGTRTDVLDPRSDSTNVHSPAFALHAAGVTASVVTWIRPGPDGKRAMDTWTPGRQICVWQIAEGLARHVPAASYQLVESKAALAVKNELLDALSAGRARQQWARQKTQMVAQLINTAEALGKHSARAREILYALPASYNVVLGEDYPTYEEESTALLLHVLQLLDLTKGSERLDAVLLTACLHLLGSLVLTGNGFMLQALFTILFEVRGAQILRLALSAPLGRLDQIAARAAEWTLASKVERGSATESERKVHDALQRDLGDGPALGQVKLETVDDPSVIAMLRALVRVMTAYAQRADEYRLMRDAFSRGAGPTPDDTLEVARRVTDLFDDEERDKIIFAMLSNSDGPLCIEAMKCLATVPTDNLEQEELDELVFFVQDKLQTHQMYVGRNEEMLMHAFNCFARVVRVPDVKDPSDKKARKGQRHGKSTGTLFREKNADLVQKALNLLVDNTKREIPSSASAERTQKGLLSAALTSFLQACSGPDSEHDAADVDAPRVWPQAVSVLQMRDATQSMVEVMKNEEQFGESHQKLELEHSALADTIEPILHTLPQVLPSGVIKARLLNRLAELLEGEHGSGDAGAAALALEEGQDDGKGESASARRKRIQGHVSFLRRNGIDLVLTQLENQLSEHRQIRRGELERSGGLDESAHDGALDDVLPAEAAPERSRKTADGVLEFVAREETRAETKLEVGNIKDEEAEMKMAVNEVRAEGHPSITAWHPSITACRLSVADGHRLPPPATDRIDRR